MTTNPSQGSMGPEGEMSPGDQAPPGTVGTGENLCRACGGSGRGTGGEPCASCSGTGVVTEEMGGA